MEEPLTFHDGMGFSISAVLNAPPRSEAVVVLCHGFLSSKNSTTNKTLTRLLSERGIAAFRFDFFGQGQSAGRFEDITVSLAIGQAMAAIEHVVTRGYRRVGLVGSSFGGLVGMLCAARRPDLACLAFKCPVVDFAEELRLEFGPEELARWKATDTIPNIAGGTERVRMKYALYEDSLHHIAYEPASRITAPTLIVQGGRDELVPLHQSRRLLDSLAGPKRLDLLPDADHQFTKAEDFHAMTTAIVDWMATYLRPNRSLTAGS
jgi:pimeloyl-ACP methyl ester carboxylesterase